MSTLEPAHDQSVVENAQSPVFQGPKHDDSEEVREDPNHWSVIAVNPIWDKMAKKSAQ